MNNLFQRFVKWIFRLVWWKRFRLHRTYYGNHHEKAGQVIPNNPRIVKVKGWRCCTWDWDGRRETVEFLFK